MSYILFLIGGFLAVVFLAGALWAVGVALLQAAFLGLVHLLFGPKDRRATSDPAVQESTPEPEPDVQEHRTARQRDAYGDEQQQEEERDRRHLELLQEEHLRREEQRLADEYAREHSYD